KSLKQGILSDLNALRATVTDKQDGQKLDQAIKHLDKSLTPAWWIDDVYPDAREGKKVFNEEKSTVEQIFNLMKDKKTSIPNMVLQDFIDRIVKVDRLLAVAAIADATGDPKAIAKSNEELNKGDTDAARGKYNTAIEHYRNAWKFAQK
ncbi:MAG: hypothetical protein PHN78_07530, partial [Dehalococcoidales bacterium]|nr:hypothetical protein [Dehalococcoidales bacterium]